LEKIPQDTNPERIHNRKKNRSHIAQNDDLISSFRPSPEVLELPLLPVRNAVLLPHGVIPLLVTREQSINAIEEAMSAEHILFAITQTREQVEQPGAKDLYSVGVEANIERALKLPDGSMSVLLRGKRRMRLMTFTQEEPYTRARGVILPDTSESPLAVEALRRAIMVLFERCIKLSADLSEEAYITAVNFEKAGAQADFIVSALDLAVPIRQNVLEAANLEQRLQRVSILLSNELDILELENQIHNKVQREIDKTQREFFLREQLRVIQRELNEGDPSMREHNELREQLTRSAMPAEVKVRANKELERLQSLPAMAPDGGIIRGYLDWLLHLPWNEATEDRLDLVEAAEILEANHYGLTKIKERILEYIAVRKLSDNMRSPILCFVGPPGVGKTSLGRSIAMALNRKFVRISLGGIHDEAEVRGHRRTYVGAMPGRIVQTMKTAGTVNPLFMLDEIDKIGADFRGDPSAALLEVLDPEQNNAFSDHYLEVPYDLSQVIFVTTANVLHAIPHALRDRLEVIELPGYTEDEKIHIAQQFLLPKQLHEHGLKPARIELDTLALQAIIRAYTSEAGVRNLEREIATIMRKVARKVAEGQKTKTRITADHLADYLGPQRYFFGLAEQHDETGVATGVAWTSAGGDLITVEATLMKGRGHLTLTGQLGDVMKESAQAALSYARSRAEQFGLEDRFYEKYDIHIHLPAGAIPKDGPSAGITMAAALISALTHRPIRREIAMTGEITLRGRVLPVGGVKEKVLAAHRAGISIFILPERNRKDLEDVPGEILKTLRIVSVERMDEVIEVALHAATFRQPPLLMEMLPDPPVEPRRRKK